LRDAFSFGWPQGWLGLKCSVSGVNFMVKLLRACVWMPWRLEAMKDVASYEKLREDASSP
jgi:hypothetical protein